MEVRKRSTKESAGDWLVKYNTDGHTMKDERVQILMLADIRREARKQTAVLERIDERLKRGGFSLAKRNRK